MQNNYRKDPFWLTKKLTPAQLQVHDVSFDKQPGHRIARYECDEVLVSTVIPEQGFGTSEKLQDKWLATTDAIGSLKLPTVIEEQKFLDAQHEYGWMSELRLDDEDNEVDCRWIHISSKFPENLKGVLVGLSDWTRNGRETIDAVRELERCIQKHERYSKHGKMFAPFFAPLVPDGRSWQTTGHQPLMISIPFLDWSVHPEKETPPLRFQVDEREGYYSGKQSAHPLRTLLQYYYHLEDTSERESKQVLAKHRPWYTDRDTDLKVRRWYGHYPASMLVDEVWILLVDSKHIVTFSANQSWKARWPALQLSSRIAELSFRGIRDAFVADEHKVKYDAVFHAIACIHGAVGLLHRSFWTDMPLPCTERYAGYLSQLQYRLYRAPSSRLVMDLLQAQDELNIVHQISESQLEVISQFKQHLSDHCFNDDKPDPLSRQSTSIDNSAGHERAPTRSNTILEHKQSSRPVPTGLRRDVDLDFSSLHQPPTASFSHSPNKSFASLHLALAALLGVHSKLRHEQSDILSLRNNANDLVTRTIQLVNIRMEDHGQAVLVFTVVTVIFLPLSFMASFFGMNTIDIRSLEYGQWIFWASGLALTLVVVVLSMVLAFYGARINEWLGDWRAGYVNRNVGEFAREWLFAWWPFGSTGRKGPAKRVPHLQDRRITVLETTKFQGYSMGQ